MHGFARPWNSYAGSIGRTCLRNFSSPRKTFLSAQNAAPIKGDLYDVELRLQAPSTSRPPSKIRAVLRRKSTKALPRERGNNHEKRDTSAPEVVKALLRKPLSGTDYESLSRYDKGYFKTDQDDIEKRKRPSPSIHLIHALQSTGKGNLLEKTLPDGRFDQTTRSKQSWKIASTSSDSTLEAEVTRDSTVSLQSITAKFIRWRPKTRAPSLDEQEGFGIIGLLEPSDLEPGNEIDRFIPPLSPEENDRLSQEGYTAYDVLLWASIFSEEDSSRAARALATHATNFHGVVLEATSRIPLFVLSFSLRRQYIGADALRTLLQYTVDYLEYRRRIYSAKLGDWEDRKLGPIDGSAIFLLFIRLLRHARMVWPSAIVAITSIITCHYLPLRDSGTGLTSDQRTLFTEQCNVALHLLSLPTSLNRMHSATHQQRAQFDLIRKMAQLHLSLPVTRLGHRALTSVLLRLKKTPQERDWARLKAPSWPPFRQSQTRLDDLKGWEYGQSRAGRALQYMQEYGYPLVDIDFAMKIISGFHVDGSPTIQTREIVLGRDSGNAQMWAAMVTATRTLPEAWACFLKYKETVKDLSAAVYHAMFKKIVYDQERLASVGGPKPDRADLHGGEDNFEKALPGDGRETFPAPEDPTDAIYIPSEPPSVESLFDQMMSDGVMPETYHLEFLMRHAPTFEFGLKAWVANQDDIPALLNDESQTETIITEELWSQEPVLRNNLPRLASQAITAFVHLLCRFPRADTSCLQQITNVRFLAIDVPGNGKHWSFHTRHAFIHAYLLAKAYRSSYRPLWTELINALARHGTMENISKHFSWKLDESHPLIALVLAQDVVASMQDAGLDIDVAAFRSLCDIAQNAAPAVEVLTYDPNDAVARERIVRSYKQGLRLSSVANHQFTACPQYLRTLFTGLVGAKSDDAAAANKPPDTVGGMASDPLSASMPLTKYLTIPNPAGLHSFARALALYGDFEGIYSLVKWMVSAKDDIRRVADHEANGHRRLVRSIIGIGALLESPGRDHRLFNVAWKHEIKGANETLKALVREEIESVPEWGGWPRKNEVEAYFRVMQDRVRAPYWLNSK